MWCYINALDTAHIEKLLKQEKQHNIHLKARCNELINDASKEHEWLQKKLEDRNLELSDLNSKCLSLSLTRDVEKYQQEILSLKLHNSRNCDFNSAGDVSPQIDSESGHR